MLVIAALFVWVFGWWLNIILAKNPKFKVGLLLAPINFGVVLLIMWELLVHGLEVSPIILPPPSAIASTFVERFDTIKVDFMQTFVKGALSGYLIGCSSAVLISIAIDKSSFMQRGLLPVGNFMAALPIIGIAPIFVMWFGFDWHSKAAVVVAMVFFPMLVNTVQGLQATTAMQRDLMQTYAASYFQSLLKLRVPAAMPFIFNGLKTTTTLALIGAIVAEFFGSPIKGMGFRISTEVGRLALDMVWAEITVAAMAGSAFYGTVAMLEKMVTFWHPSQRERAG